MNIFSKKIYNETPHLEKKVANILHFLFAKLSHGMKMTVSKSNTMIYMLLSIYRKLVAGYHGFIDAV